MTDAGDKLFELLAPPPAPEWIKNVVRHHGGDGDFFASVDEAMRRQHEEAVKTFEAAFKARGPIKIKLPMKWMEE